MILCSPAAPAVSRAFVPSPRPAKLDGLRIGLLDNTKAPVDHMMKRIAEHLRARVPGCTVFGIAKQRPVTPMETEVFQALKEQADVVIDALGD